MNPLPTALHDAIFPISEIQEDGFSFMVIFRRQVPRQPGAIGREAGGHAEKSILRFDVFAREEKQSGRFFFPEVKAEERCVVNIVIAFLFIKIIDRLLRSPGRRPAADRQFGLTAGFQIEETEWAVTVGRRKRNKQ